MLFIHLKVFLRFCNSFMSFAIRQTWKPRFNPNLDNSNPVSMPDEQETKAIITAIQKFKQKSAHSNIQNIAELQTVLSKSSINPEINPGAKQGVESILRGKNDNQAESTIEQLMDVPATTSGFSSQSTTRFNVRTQVDKLEKELAKELEEIKQQFRPKPNPVPETKEEKYNEDATDPEIEALIEENEEDERQFENQQDLNHLVAPGFGPQSIRPGMSLTSAAQRNAPTQSTQTKNKAPENSSEYAVAKKLISVGYPARAAMARGFQPRASGLSGNAMRKTPLGLSDAF